MVSFHHLYVPHPKSLQKVNVLEGKQSMKKRTCSTSRRLVALPRPSPYTSS